MFMSKSKSFGGIPLTMSWYTGKFPESDSASSQQPTRGSSGSAQAAQNPWHHQHAPVINADGAGDSIKLKLAPVQQDSRAMGPGGGGWGDDFGKEEGVSASWSSTGWGKGNRSDGGEFLVWFRCMHPPIWVPISFFIVVFNGRTEYSGLYYIFYEL